MDARTTTHPRDYTNPLARWLYGTGLEEGLEAGANQLLALVSPLCSAEELATLRELPDLVSLRRAVQQRLGLPVTDEDAE